MAFVDHPVVHRLNDGRLQLRHGPIDLIIEAFGSRPEVEAAYQQASNSFTTVLTELSDELSELRKQPGRTAHVFQGSIAMTMSQVAQTFAVHHFVTPMIAVAGAVADHVLRCMTLNRVLTKAYVNNGGDIAIYLGDKQSFSVGVCANPLDGAIVSKTNVPHDSDIRGIATSGWRGRSHSLGIADSVTVLARTAATADAAATLIANAIDLPKHPMIQRTAATTLNPDSDLGDKLVTVDVGSITLAETLTALDAGQKLAQSMIASEQIIGVYGSLNSEMFSLRPSPLPLSVSDETNKLNIDSLEKEPACA